MLLVAYKKWDIVWVYWLHIDKIKDFLNIELSNFWKENSIIIEKIWNNSKKIFTNDMKKNINKFFIWNEKVNKIVEQNKLEFSNNLEIEEKNIILLDCYHQLFELLISLLDISKEPIKLFKKIIINEKNIYDLFFLINMYKEISLNIEVLKNNESIYRPCVIFHRASDYYWVMPIHTIKEDKNNYNSKFDILLNKKSIIKCCSLEKTHISLIEGKKIINNKDKIDNLDLQNKITEKFTWFFLK